MLKRIISWILSLWIAFVFIQSLYFKFRASPETEYIFTTIGEWMEGNFLQFIAQPFADYGGYVIGVFELLASIMLIIPTVSRPLGGLLATILMTGAIFFHIFTPLGINVQLGDGTGDGGLLFYMACSVWVAGLIVFYLHRDRLILFR